MMWSLIVVACLGTADGAECRTVKFHMIETRMDCIHLRNERRRMLAEVDLVRLVTRCEPGVFS